MNIRELFEISPTITAVENEEGLNHAMETDNTVIFTLYGTILNIQKTMDRIRDHEKLAIVYMDLTVGFSSKGVVIDFIGENTSADGIISTKPMLIRHVVELSLIGGQRTLPIDSMALNNMKEQLESFRPGFMRLMPSVMPGVLHTIHQVTNIPLVAGGLLSDKKDIMAAFDAGVDVASTTKEQLWYVQG